ncbi:MAG: Cof-type HAD-IIB family hydrolase [Phycisphaerae bacterium]
MDAKKCWSLDFGVGVCLSEINVMSVDALVDSFRRFITLRSDPISAPHMREIVALGSEPVPPDALSSFTTGNSGNGQVVQMIALDMDGTVLNPRESITPRVHHAIHLAVKRGIQVVLATARPPRSVRFYHRALKLKTPIISHNGALIWDENKKCVIRHISLPHALVRRVIDFARNRCPEVIPSVEIIDKLYSDHFGMVPIDAIPVGRTFNPDVIAAMETFLHVPVTRVMFHAKPSVIDELYYLLPRRFEHRIGLFRSDSRLLQIVAPDTNKAMALDYVCKSYGISRTNVLAVGDNANDLPMFQWAGISAAMANGPEHIRKAAGHVVPSNREDGVAVAIERFALA